MLHCPLEICVKKRDLLYAHNTNFQAISMFSTLFTISLPKTEPLQKPVNKLGSANSYWY